MFIFPCVPLLPGLLAQPADSPDFPMFVVLALGGVPMALGWIIAIIRCGLLESLGRAALVLACGLLILGVARLAGGYELAPMGALLLGVPSCWALAIYLASRPSSQNRSEQ